MDSFMKSGPINSKNNSGNSTGLKRISWRQQSQPQLKSKNSFDMSTLCESLARKRSLPRTPVAAKVA
ncbi:unnamed protein product [Onchocerca ochengi]|uniref:Ovule protein n=1 Tax=Onchocerca ochengi TaxID=42157 RepID=A0A182EB05_ONCOC|nr:unnamed protein product [Onchocerca ochengi]